MEIKKGQVWQNKKGEKFLIIDAENEWHEQDYCQVQVLQDTEVSLSGEIYNNVSKDQFYNMQLVEELEYNKELNLTVKIRTALHEKRVAERQISNLQDNIENTLKKIDKLYTTLKRVNPNTLNIVKIDGVYHTKEELEGLVGEVLKERK